VEKINVAIVDDNQEFLRSMMRYLGLSKDILVVGTATTKEEALKLPEIYNIDIMLMDINISENKCDGILAANQILTNYLQKPKIIMLTDHNNKDLVQRSFLAGAVYYVLKTDFKSLPNTIRHIYNNDFPVGSVLKDCSDLMKDKVLKSEFLLSDTEIVIYKLVENGNSQSKIVRELYISESTYKKHVNHILRKIKATSIKKAIDKYKEIFFTKELDKSFKD